MKGTFVRDLLKDAIHREKSKNHFTGKIQTNEKHMKNKLYCRAATTVPRQMEPQKVGHYNYELLKLRRIDARMLNPHVMPDLQTVEHLQRKKKYLRAAIGGKTECRLVWGSIPAKSY